jgi:putative ABC transport system permease protein
MLRQDLKIALRLWRKRPLWAAAAVLTIALGTGMNVALFRMVWSVLLKPLPYQNSARLVQVWRVDEKADSAVFASDRHLPDSFTLERWRERSHSFENLAIYRAWMSTVTGGGDPERISSAVVSAEFFPALRVRALVGRTFSPAEVRPGSDSVVVLSYAYWQRHLGGDPSVLGRILVVDAQPVRVIGILPPDFRGIVVSPTREPQLYLPISKIATGSLRVSSGWVLGRLKPGVSRESARLELATLAREAALEHSQPVESNGVSISNLQDTVGGTLRPILLALFGATVCVLLIACANVANLLLSRTLERRRELSIRACLGATRGHIARQMLAEALLVAVSGGLLGLGAAWGLFRLMVALYPGVLPRVEEGGTFWIVLCFAMLLSTASAVISGVLPAWRATRECSYDALRAGRGSLGQGARRWANVLVAAQVGVTVVVLVAAGLLLKSFVLLRSLDVGFAHERILTAQVVLPESVYRTREEQTRFAREWVERLNAIPGVESAALTNSLPLAANLLMDIGLTIPGWSGMQKFGGRVITGAYFDCMGLRMKEGRPLTPADDNRKDVVVVNEAFARHFFGSRPVVGTVLGSGTEVLTIVGLVRDLRNIQLQRPPDPEVYLTFAAHPGIYLDTVLRVRGNPAGVLSAARTELRAINPGLVLAKVSTMEKILDSSVATPRFQAVLLGLFAVVALVLASIGTYAVIAQGVRSRTSEFGVRMALGARAWDVFRLVVGQGMRAPLVGLAAGILGALAAGSLLQGLLFGITPRDPLVFATVPIILALVALAACGVPARHAARVAPAEALRAE